ncbi:MAG: hypothetical protein DYH05_12015 [Acidobacteria bacterium ACB1]|nr:hypothetical protein [Pyrinomonadaceae bacterium]MCE7963206.1 hypothetical protein [Acidobacteria bacterium ACB1]
MTRNEAKDKLEFVETSKEEHEHGLRRIKRRHYTGPPELLGSQISLEELREELLNDPEFIDRLRKKLAA